MSNKKHHIPGPIPAGNRPGGGNTTDPDAPVSDAAENAGASFQEQDPKRRLGDFSGTGEHPRQQPGPLNDGDRHSK